VLIDGGRGYGGAVAERTASDRSRPRLAADCSQCFALCCTTLELTVSSDFAIDKPAGTPCPQLDRRLGCRIHPVLRQKGYSGCTVYDCFGAGQQVSQVTFGGRDWRTDREVAAMVVDVFPIVRVLHELRWHVRAAGLDETELEQLSLGSAAELVALDLDEVWDRTDALLLEVAERLRGGGPDLRAQMLVGADLAGRDLTGASLRGARMVSADLSAAVLCRADVTGADLRRADIRGADLSEALFLTQAQVDSASGDVGTLLPHRLKRPLHWAPVSL
jgi:uncharacterized protein YjbI with pentapeptide repeats